MADGSPVGSEDPGESFAEEARTAGLNLPTQKRVNLWDVAAITSVVLLVCVGLGVATGWVNPHTSNSLPPGLLTPQSCSGEGGQHVALSGSVSSDSDPELGSALTIASNQFTSSYGGCVSFSYAVSSDSVGLAPLAAKQADFAVVEVPPTAAQLSSLPDSVVVFPLGLTSLSLVYNLPGVPSGLNLSASVLEQIYSGKITSWNDPAIAQLNPGTVLPGGLAISVVYRSDATALNTEFTEYLAADSASWNSSVGQGLQVPWPVGTGEAGSASLVSEVATTSGAIGYVETGTALPASLGTAKLGNADGIFLAPTEASLAAAATSAANASALEKNWSEVSLLNAPGSAAYPLAFLDYAVVYADVGVAYAGNLTLFFSEWELTYLWWVATDAGYLTAPTGFVPLPAPILTATQFVLGKVAFDGKSVLEGSEGGEAGGETGEF